MRRGVAKSARYERPSHHDHGISRNMPTQRVDRFVYAMISLTGAIAAGLSLAAHLPDLNWEAHRFLMASAASEMFMCAGAVGEDPYAVVPPEVLPDAYASR